MALFSLFKDKSYFLLVAILAVFMLGFYPFVQILPQGLNNYWFWFTLLTPARWILYFLYGILFGIAISFFIGRLKSKTCDIRPKTTGGMVGFAGTLTGFVLPQCAACLSVVSLLLPTSITFFLVKYTTEVMVASNLLLLAALYSLGAFKK